MKIYNLNKAGRKLNTVEGVKEVAEDGAVEFENEGVAINYIKNGKGWSEKADGTSPTLNPKKEEPKSKLADKKVPSILDNELKDLIIERFNDEDLIKIGIEAKIGLKKAIKEDSNKLRKFVKIKLEDNQFMDLVRVLLTEEDED